MQLLPLLLVRGSPPPYFVEFDQIGGVQIAFSYRNYFGVCEGSKTFFFLKKICSEMTPECFLVWQDDDWWRRWKEMAVVAYFFDQSIYLSDEGQLRDIPPPPAHRHLPRR